MDSESKTYRNACFSLKIANIDQVHTTYKLVENVSLPVFTASTVSHPENTTLLTELNTGSRSHSSYTENGKRFYITMVDDLKKTEIRPDTFCFWCRHPFTTQGIGCPVKYVTSKISKACMSEVTKEKFVIQQKVSQYTIKNTPTFP